MLIVIACCYLSDLTDITYMFFILTCFALLAKLICMLRYVYCDLFTLRGHSNWRANNNEHGKGTILTRTFVPKVLNNERKILNHHEMTDCIAEQLSWWLLNDSKNQNYGFIRTYDGQVSHLHIHQLPLLYFKYIAL